MTRLRSLLVVLAALLLLAGVTIAQGPKKDVGTKLPLPDTRDTSTDGVLPLDGKDRTQASL